MLVHAVMDIARATSITRQPTTTDIVAFVMRYLPLASALGIFLGIALHQLHLPGLYYDEALDLVPMLHVMRGEQPELMRNIGIDRFPVMLLDYMGSLGGYLSVPFMHVFGPGYVAARAQPIFFSCVTIVLAWLLARRWFGAGVAAVTALLLAVNPSFIWFSRQGISVTSVMTVFSLGSVLLLDEAAGAENQKLIRKDWALALGSGLLLGLGLWAKFLFFRWIVVLIVIGIVCLLTRSREARRIQTQKQRLIAFTRPLLIGLAGLLIGAAPLIYYNVVGLVRDGQPWTLALLLSALLNPTQQFGVNNLDFFNNIQKSIDDVRVFIDGSYFWYNGVPFSNVYAVPAFLISVVVGSLLAVTRLRTPLSQREKEQGVRFFALIAGVVALVFLGAFTVSGLWSTHQFIMLPLPQMIVACAAVWLSEIVARFLTGKTRETRKRGKMWTNLVSPLSQLFLVCLLLLLPFSRDLWVNQQHHATLAATGGSGRFSDAVYVLADWLDGNKIAQPVALDWGIEKQVRVLTGDRVRPVEIFGFTPEADDAFHRRAEEMLADPSRRYIVLWGGDGNNPGFAVYNRRQAFAEIAHQAGKQVVETFIAHERSGLPVYVVLQAK